MGVGRSGESIMLSRWSAAFGARARFCSCTDRAAATAPIASSSSSRHAATRQASPRRRTGRLPRGTRDHASRTPGRPACNRRAGPGRKTTRCGKMLRRGVPWRRARRRDPPRSRASGSSPRASPAQNMSRAGGAGLRVSRNPGCGFSERVCGLARTLRVRRAPTFGGQPRRRRAHR